MIEPERAGEAPLIRYEPGAIEDAPFDALRRQALRVIQRVASTWTDHNLHDPGITLLEAGVWGISDLAYRVQEAIAMQAPVDLEAPDSLPPDLERSARLAAACALLDRFGETAKLVEQRSAAADGAQFPSPAYRALFESVAQWKDAEPPSWGATSHAVEARGAMERGGTFLGYREASAESSSSEARVGTERVARTLERRSRRWWLHSRWPAVRDALASTLQGSSTASLETLGSEIDRQTSRRSHAESPRVLEALSAEPLTRGVQPTNGEVATLLARLDSPLDPRLFEDDEGQTRVWPPHPSQVETTDPVTNHDLLAALYAQLARIEGRIEEASVTYVRRADAPHASAVPRPGRVWSAPGMIARRRGGAGPEFDEPGRPGALSLLVERRHDLDSEDVLDLCAEAFEVGPPRTFWGHRDFAPLAEAGRRCTRPLGLEIHFGFVRPVKIQIACTIDVRFGESTDVARSRAIEVLRRFLANGAESTPVVNGDYVTGWPPGTAVDSHSIRERLLRIDTVERVGRVRLRVSRDGAEPVAGGTLRPYEVPDYEDGDALDVTAVQPLMVQYRA